MIKPYSTSQALDWARQHPAPLAAGEFHRRLELKRKLGPDEYIFKQSDEDEIIAEHFLTRQEIQRKRNGMGWTRC